jgi:hypothetical protein
MPGPERAACRRARSLVTLELLTILQGCATNHAPVGFLIRPESAETSAYGGWMELYFRDGANERVAMGELLVIEPDSVWIFGAGGPVAIATASVTRGMLTASTGGPERSVPPFPWSDLAPFARFPQGWPEGVRPEELRPKRPEPPALYHDGNWP